MNKTCDMCGAPMKFEKLKTGDMWFCTKCVRAEPATTREMEEPTYEEILLAKKNPNKDERQKIMSLVFGGVL